MPRKNVKPLQVADLIAALEALLKRLDTGQWDQAALRPAALNAAAAAEGADMNELFGFSLVPAFAAFVPPPFPRPHPKGSIVPA